MTYDGDEPRSARRLPLMAHGSVTRPMILFTAAILAVLAYGFILLTTPAPHDNDICATWLQQYTERVNSPAVFEKAGYAFKDITATSHGIYFTIDIRTDKPCSEIPRPIDAYFSHNKLGMFMMVHLHTEGEEKPTCTQLY